MPPAVDSDYNLRRAGQTKTSRTSRRGGRASSRSRTGDDQGPPAAASSSTATAKSTARGKRKRNPSPEPPLENGRKKKGQGKQTMSDDEDGTGKGKSKAASKGKGGSDEKELKQTSIRDFGFLEEEVNCPINQEPFEDPVVACDGMTYERRAILDWFAVCRNAKKPLTSPLTGASITSNLRPNNLIKNITSQLKDKGLI